MGDLNKEKNFTFYLDARTKDIVREWVEMRERGLTSKLICKSIQSFYRHPYNPMEMLDRGLDKLDNEEMELFNLFIDAAKEAQREWMQKVMEAKEPEEINQLDTHD